MRCVGMIVVWMIAVILAGCSRVPWTAEEGTSEIGKVRDAIECELAAVAQNSRFKSYALNTWSAKTNLQLTLVSKLGADGKLEWVIPHGSSPIPVTPTLGVSGTEKSVATLDFSTQLSDALAYFGSCAPGPDPSGTGMGLAAWFESTLMALRKGQHAGLAFTSEFEIVGSAGARFGYTMTRVTADAGFGGSRLGNNRFTVAVAAPPGEPKPISVVIAGQKKVLIVQETNEKVESKSILDSTARRAPVQSDNSTLNRLLDRQAPVRLEPQ